MITAEQARDLVRKNDNSELRSILNQIEAEANNGNNHIDVFDPSPQTLSTLGYLGYNILPAYNEITLYVKVSW